ncbi:MAG TPA: DUF393 domain-containing protein [Gemmataceae bacterium]|jgi:predicted DCC family thiol-disulfide oxidoreductase YuxK|nr:DUF393 domain-containing protein [Gemmataceae bacterium]
MKLKVFYDGHCHLCSREMGYFHRRAAARIDFIDYTAPEFDAQAEGLDPAALDRSLHVKLADGQLRLGIDAVIELWKVVPGYGWLARLADHPVLRPLLRLGYICFAHLRRRLPRRKQRCPLKQPAPPGEV